ncbi:hypothetical protein CI238_00177, partial [Colletotrichum incanum]
LISTSPTPVHAAIYFLVVFSERHTHLTMRTALGVRPASFRVLLRSIWPSNVFLGNVVEKLVTSKPFSDWSIWATSNRVVSAGRVFKMLPPDVCSLKRASLWFAVAFGMEGAVTGPGSGALPSLAALASSALRRRSSLSASILALMRRFASRSSCFSWRFLAASLICSLRCNSSLASWVSLVAFMRIFSLRLASSLSKTACFAFFSLSCSRSSASLAFFCSSVKGAISSVDSEKSV